MDKIEIDPRVRVGVPAQARSAVSQLATMDCPGGQVDGGEAGGDFPGPAKRPTRAGLGVGNDPIDDRQISVIRVVFTRDQIRNLPITS